jgi:hypothetical protein
VGLDIVGKNVGIEILGAYVGTVLGLEIVGFKEGKVVGNWLGVWLGKLEGWEQLGEHVGVLEGGKEGFVLGLEVVGYLEGPEWGLYVGLCVGIEVGFDVVGSSKKKKNWFVYLLFFCKFRVQKRKLIKKPH